MEREVLVRVTLFFCVLITNLISLICLINLIKNLASKKDEARFFLWKIKGLFAAEGLRGVGYGDAARYHHCHKAD